MTTEKIPFVDLYAQYLSIQEEIDAAIAGSIRETSFIGGRPVAEFESAFARFLGMPHVVSCANGTDSMEIILKAWGIGAGHEVIVPAHSWISTSEAVGNVGARPVFVDVDPERFTIDVNRIEEAVTPRTRAIIPVHLYGHPADMPAIMDIARRHGLKVLEDCAQSHGARVGGRLTGTIGDASSFSFYPGKNLGCYGDGGCMATADPDLAERIRMIANHGQKGKHNHLLEGRNSRLDGLQATILSAKLPHLEGWNRRRREIATGYTERLGGLHVQTPTVSEDCTHVFHLYVIRTERREGIMQVLKERNIETAIHYPTVLPLLPCYADLGHVPGQFPVAFANQSRILSLPIYPEMNESMLDRVAEAIKSALDVPVRG